MVPRPPRNGRASTGDNLFGRRLSGIPEANFGVLLKEKLGISASAASSAIATTTKERGSRL